MTATDVRALLDLDENSRVEFKAEANRATAKAIAAFSSSEGGTILVGVEDDTRKVIGIDNFELAAQQVDSWISAFVDPTPLIHYHCIKMEDGKQVLAIQVPKGVFPAYSFKGIPYLRLGKTCQPMTAEECHGRWRMYEFREGLAALAQVISDNEPRKNTAAAIAGQSELATMAYEKLLRELKQDLFKAPAQDRISQ